MIEHLSPPATTGFPDHWYPYADGDHFWMQWRFAVAQRLLARLGLDTDRPLRALDIGGGAGGFRGQLESGTRWSVDLTDVNLAALELAPAAARGRTLCYDVTRPDPSLVASYDACFLFDVIEHVAQPRELLAAALAHLQPGGVLIVNVPALRWLFCAFDVANGRRAHRSPAAARSSARSRGGRR